MTSTLKILISAAGLAAMAATPVLAASHVRHAAPAAPVTTGSTTVIAPNGQVLGADPDAQIRLELQRDWGGATASGR
jgi:hypothetical protein